MPSMEVALVDGNRAAPAPRRKGLCPLCRLNAALLFVGTGLMLAVGITTLGWKTKPMASRLESTISVRMAGGHCLRRRRREACR